MYTCTYVQILQLKGKLSNIDVTQNQFCAIDDLSGYPIIRFE